MRLRYLVLVLGCWVGLSACGSSDEDTTGSTEQNSSDAITEWMIGGTEGEDYTMHTDASGAYFDVTVPGSTCVLKLYRPQFWSSADKIPPEDAAGARVSNFCETEIPSGKTTYNFCVRTRAQFECPCDWKSYKKKNGQGVEETWQQAAYASQVQYLRGKIDLSLTLETKQAQSVSAVLGGTIPALEGSTQGAWLKGIPIDTQLPADTTDSAAACLARSAVFVLAEYVPASGKLDDPDLVAYNKDYAGRVSEWFNVSVSGTTSLYKGNAQFTKYVKVQVSNGTVF